MQKAHEIYYSAALVITLLIIFIVILAVRNRTKFRRTGDHGTSFERKKFIYALFFPTMFLFLVWFVKLAETGLNTSFAHFGLYPREVKGLPGIILSPLIHDDYKHLFDNSIPFFLLSLAVFYFYREIALKVFIAVYLSAGIMVWIIAREAYHIGASGLIYGFASFLFFSGVIRKNVDLLAISLVVIFLYGSLVWGILPFDYHISWEGHMSGGIAGLVLAIIYRREGPQRKVYSWELEEDEEEQTEE